MHVKLETAAGKRLTNFARTNKTFTTRDAVTLVMSDAGMGKWTARTLLPICREGITPWFRKQLRKPLKQSPMWLSMTGVDPELADLVQDMPWFISDGAGVKAKNICIVWASVQELTQAVELRDNIAKSIIKKADLLDELVKYLNKKGVESIGQALEMETR